MTKDNLETIKNKVRKLLGLSKSDNENEARSALEKANELIMKYDLDEAGLHFESARVKSTKTYVPWRSLIANAVSWLYGCYHYRDADDGTMVFAGESLDSFMAGEMFQYLIKAIERTAKKSIRKNAKYNFRRDFKYGMANRLYDRITELGELCSWAPKRTIKIEEAENYIKGVETITNPETKKVKLNKRAIAKGALYGNGVSLSRQAGYSPALRIETTLKTNIQQELF